jgi:hypothetical protein
MAAAGLRLSRHFSRLNACGGMKPFSSVWQPRLEHSPARDRAPDQAKRQAMNEEIETPAKAFAVNALEAVTARQAAEQFLYGMVELLSDQENPSGCLAKQTVALLADEERKCFDRFTGGWVYCRESGRIHVLFFCDLFRHSRQPIGRNTLEPCTAAVLVQTLSSKRNQRTCKS